MGCTKLEEGCLSLQSSKFYNYSLVCIGMGMVCACIYSAAFHYEYSNLFLKFPQFIEMLFKIIVFMPGN